MQEYDMIRKVAAIHGLTPFSTDAEYFGNMLYSMDSFSKHEDFFEYTEPLVIGHNMAAAACADLLASGCKPEFLLQSWNFSEEDDEAYYLEISRGIESVLKHYGAKCIGGDTGGATVWNWTATVGGRGLFAPVKRSASRKVPFDLYLSGGVGDANFAAFFRHEMPVFELRDPVPEGTLFATDTSGGFLDALENFRRLDTNFSVLIDFIPYAVHSPLPFPEEYLLIGGVGEYELLYAVPRGMKADGIKIGSGDFSGRGVNFKKGGSMNSSPPDYRNISSEKWLSATENYYREVFL